MSGRCGRKVSRRFRRRKRRGSFSDGNETLPDNEHVGQFSDGNEKLSDNEREGQFSDTVEPGDR